MPRDLLVVNRWYRLAAMRRALWDSGHPLYGTPDHLAARYLGSLQGARRWHGFEVWIAGKEEGVIFMTDADVQQIEIAEVT